VRLAQGTFTGELFTLAANRARWRMARRLRMKGLDQAATF
jgi:hypothetical protein